MEYQYLLPFVLLVAINQIHSITADCPIVSVPAGGYVLSGCSTRPNSVCSIQCSSTGIVQSQICQSNGFWSGPQFNCYGGNGLTPGGGGYFNGGTFGGTNFGQGLMPGGQGTCVSLIAPVNGYYSGNCAPGIVGGTCVFTCRPGHLIRGSSILSCLSTGTWSAGVPTCTTQTRWYLLVRRWFG